MRKRNKFSLSNLKIFTCDMGYVIPFNWFAVLPGDSIQMQTSMLLRCTPLLAPLMHPVDVRIAHFYVPYDIIWTDFPDFITGGNDGDDATVPPRLSLNGDLSGYESGLADYMGVPPIDYTGKGMYCSALPFRAYHTIWNEYFRDQDLVTAEDVGLGNGTDTTTSKIALKSAAWGKDYFTTARTSQQRGTAVSIPFSDLDPPITGLGMTTQSYTQSSASAYETDGTGSTTYADAAYGGTTNSIFEEDPNNSGFPNVRADLSNVGIDLDDFRLTLALQKYMERTNRYGARYSDYLRQLGIRPRDSRRGLPELLASGRQTIQFSEVLEHSSTGTLGSMAGHGIAAVRSNRFRRFIPEHGLIMSMLSVVPKAIRSQGLHKEFNKTIKEEYYQPELENIGDQAILCREIYVDAADPDAVFGYQDIFDEYRSLPSGIAGEFRSTMDHWHMGIDYAAEPSLNSSFITCTPRKDGFASSSTDALYCYASNSIQARRPIRKRR